MKCLLILFAVLTVISTAPSIEDNQAKISEVQELLKFKNPLDELWRQALEFVRTLLIKYEPFEVPDMPEQTVSGDGIDLKAKFDHVKVSKARDFTIDHLENNLFGLWAKFGVTVPQMHLEGNYTVKGTIKSKSVQGNGYFKMDLDKLATEGYTKIAFKGTYLQMTQLDISYTLKGVKFSLTDLVVDGITPEELKEYLSDATLLKYLQDHEEFVCKQISTYVMQISNQIMYNKSLQGLLDWLKDFIDGKIVTTPKTLLLS